MSTNLANYSPERVNVVVALSHTISGFAAGTFVSISKDNPTFTVRESSDGVISRTLNRSMLYTVTLTLAQSSDSNNVLSLMHTLDLATAKAKFPMTIKDSSGESVFFASECWVTTIPPAVFSDGIETREWIITCSGAVNFVAGNYNEAGLLDNLLSLAGGTIGGVL